jgi:hypothetical protein
LAFAATGLMIFPVEGRYEYVTAHLEELARTITSADQLIVTDIAAVVRARFQPAMDLERDKVQVFIALFKNGRADVGVQRVSDHRITDDPTRFVPGCRHYIMPGELWDFYGQGARLEALHQATLADSQEVGCLTRRLMQEGIDHERTLHASGANKTIGGDLDVVLVNQAGASLLPAA